MSKMVPLSSLVWVNPPTPIPEDFSPQSEVAFVPMASVGENGTMTVSQTRCLAEVTTGYTSFMENDVLLAKITPCMENGKATVAKRLGSPIGFGSTEFHVLRPKPGVDSRFVFHQIWNARFRNEAARNMTGSAGQKRVPKAFLERYEVPDYQGDEQTRIATILDKADAIRRKRQEALRLTDDFLRSVFLDMFEGYLDANASDRFESVLAMPLNNGFFAKNDQYGSGTPVIWVDNLYHTSLINTASLRRAEMTANDLRKYMVLEDDLLFTRSSLVRDGIGQCNVVPKLDEPMTFECHIIRARIDPDKAHPRYIQGLFRSAFGKSQILRRANTATMTTISQGSLEDLPCPLPPLPLQKRYAEIVKAVEKGATSMADTVASTNNLFSSLQQRAFSGQL